MRAGATEALPQIGRVCQRAGRRGRRPGARPSRGSCSVRPMARRWCSALRHGCSPTVRREPEALRGAIAERSRSTPPTGISTNSSATCMTVAAMRAVQQVTGMTAIRVEINGSRGRRRRAAAPVARRFSARAAQPDRDPSRLRARCVRRLHGPCRRRAGARLPDARGRLRRARGARPSKALPATRSWRHCAGRFHRHHGIAMRVLHAGDADHRARPDPPRTGRLGARDPRRPRREHLPLHRLYQHRHRDRRGRGGAGQGGADAE